MRDVSKALRLLQRIRRTDYFSKYNDEISWWAYTKLRIIYSRSLLEKLIYCFLEHDRPLLALLLVNTYTSIVEVGDLKVETYTSHHIAVEAGHLLKQVDPIMYSKIAVVLSWKHDHDALNLYLKTAEKYLQFDHNKSAVLLLFILARFQFHVLDYQKQIKDDIFPRIEFLITQLKDTDLKQKIIKLWEKIVYTYQIESWVP